jgi:hypothetical protein
VGAPAVDSGVSAGAESLCSGVSGGSVACLAVVQWWLSFRRDEAEPRWTVLVYSETPRRSSRSALKLRLGPSG